MTTLRQFLAEDRGATAIEYGLIASLIALVVVGGAGALGNSLLALWNDGSSQIVEVLGMP